MQKAPQRKGVELKAAAGTDHCLRDFVAKKAKSWGQQQLEVGRGYFALSFLEIGGGQHVCVLAKMV